MKNNSYQAYNLHLGPSNSPIAAWVLVHITMPGFLQQYFVVHSIQIPTPPQSLILGLTLLQQDGGQTQRSSQKCRGLQVSWSGVVSMTETRETASTKWKKKTSSWNGPLTSTCTVWHTLPCSHTQSVRTLTHFKNSIYIKIAPKDIEAAVRGRENVWQCIFL